ncbi:hypothetical protein [Pseudomarimonas arenosa]|uniref:Uncharacterized protein n=1 Tax=Pseudomarimonas arenosa TaxID=2774145 RepID=A0AAW3ZSC4_9GAMM|nr:hypothetical protein [Pseudomarimonas arenosa]MBD8527121.1 hypothetical protein [Pseudomarimonas arenosa]
MSAAEFKAAGLDKLSEAELRALNDWLRSKGTTAAAAAQAPDLRGLSKSSLRKGGNIVSRIPGEFTGWRGQTTFTLENGQIWQSTDPGASFVVRLQSPTVTISPGVLDTWFLQVEGYNSSVKVKRIQ